MDGRLGARPGVRSLLTGPAANRRVQRQRAEVDAIGIGSGTLLTDDPLLTARGAYRARPLTRVVFDRRLRTPPSARLLSTLGAGPVIIVTTDRACALAPDRAEGLEAAGALILAAASRRYRYCAARTEADGADVPADRRGRRAAPRRAGRRRGRRAARLYHPGDPRPGWRGVAGRGPDRLGGVGDCRAVWLGADVLVEGVVRHVHRNH